MKHFLSILYLALFLLIVSAINSFAQVDPLYSQYLNNPLILNPAYSGMTNDFQASVSYRRQWAGFDGSPATVNFNSHLSAANNKMGVGLIVLQDRIGNNINSECYATYAYHIQSANTMVSFGMQAGVMNFSTDNSELNAYDPSDPAFSSSLNMIKPNFGAGMIIRSDRVFIGLSVPRLLDVDNNALEDQTLNVYTQHFYANLAYIFFLSEHVRFKPSVLLKGVKGSPVSVDYNMFFNLNEKYTAGLFLRNRNSYGTQVQLKLNDTFRLGYAFEVPTNRSVGTAYTTHEICLTLSTQLLPFHKTSIYSF